MSWRETAEVLGRRQAFENRADEMEARLAPSESVILIGHAGKISCGFTTLKGRLTLFMVTTNRFYATTKTLYLGRFKELDIPLAEIGDGTVHKGANQLFTRYSCRLRRGVDLTLLLTTPSDAEAVGRAFARATAAR